MIALTASGIIFSQSESFSPINVGANSSIDISLNHNLSNGTLISPSEALTLINTTSRLNGASLPIASQVDSLELKAYVSQSISGIEINQTQAGTSKLDISFSTAYGFFTSISVVASKLTGNGDLSVFINNSATVTTTFVGGSGFITYTFTEPNGNPIHRISLLPQSGQNRWAIDNISLGSINLVNFSNKVLTYTMLNALGGGTCLLDEDLGVTTKLTDQEIIDLNNLYNSFSDAEKNNFKTTYPNSWARLKWMFDRKNLSYI